MAKTSYFLVNVDILCIIQKKKNFSGARVRYAGKRRRSLIRKSGFLQQKLQDFCYQNKYAGSGCLYKIQKSMQELEKLLKKKDKKRKQVRLPLEPSSKQTEIYEKIVKFNRIIRPVFAVFNKSKRLQLSWQSSRLLIYLSRVRVPEGASKALFLQT